MFQAFWLGLFLKIYQFYHKFYHKFYHWVWDGIFSLIGSVVIIYRLEKGVLRNVTIQYYLGEDMGKGTFYAAIYNKQGINHISFVDDVDQIKYLSLATSSENPPHRKNITFILNDTPCYINLDILDNYKSNIDRYSNPVTDLKRILTCLGINATHVKIIEIKPFSKIICKVEEMAIGHLYLE